MPHRSIYLIFSSLLFYVVQGVLHRVLHCVLHHVDIFLLLFAKKYLTNPEACDIMSLTLGDEAMRDFDILGYGKPAIGLNSISHALSVNLERVFLFGPIEPTED